MRNIRLFRRQAHEFVSTVERQPLKIDVKCVHLVCCGPHGRRKLSDTIFVRVPATVHGHCGREQRTDPSAGIDCNFSGRGSRSECTCINSRHFWPSCAKASMNSTIGWKWAEISVGSVRPVVNVRMVVTSDTCRKMAFLARDHGDYVRQAACAQRLAPIVPSLPTFPRDVQHVTHTRGSFCDRRRTTTLSAIEPTTDTYSSEKPAQSVSRDVVQAQKRKRVKTRAK